MAVREIEAPSPTEILSALDGASTREQRVQRLTRLGLSEDQAADAIEIVDAASSRALALSAGMSPDQSHSALEDDPLFLAVLRRAGHNVGPGASPGSGPSWRTYTFALVATGILVIVAFIVLLRLVVAL